MTITLRDACPDDVPGLAERLRDADKVELYEAGFDNTLEGLSQSLLHSGQSWAILNDNVVEALAGVTELEDGSGIIWAMTSKDLMKSSKQFVKASRLVFEKLKGFNKLHNYVCASNIVHIQWLQSLGFNIHFDNYIVPRNIPFFYFTRS